MRTMSSEQAALHFPMSAKVPESSRHFRLRMVLYQFLKRAFEDVAMIGSDQFLYWEPKNPRACLAPDAFVCFGNKNADFDSWKVWERGVPQVAVEIVSDSDASEASWEVKLDRYRRVGVSELVWFDYHAKERPLRIWDFVGDDLLERRLSEPYAQSQHLGGYWLPVETDNGDLSLRLSRDEQGLQLFPTAEEYYAEQRWVEAEKRRAAEAALGRESEARQRESEALQSRIAELEAELRRRS